MRIAHISDIHCNYGSDFNENIYTKAVNILNTINPDLVFIIGDLTTEGLLREYQLADEKLKTIHQPLAIVPGNHDERNLGFKLFPEFFGDTDFIKSINTIQLIGLATSEPDRDEGRLGRNRHKLIQEGSQQPNKFTILGFHHHVIPIPNSGRETNIIEDAGETLDIILRNNIPLVLMGHRHVPYGVKIHNTLFVNSGTFSCTRTRARFGNTFNIIDINNEHVTITVVNIEHNTQQTMIQFNTKTHAYINHYYDPHQTLNTK